MTPFGINENKYSSSSKLLRITAYVNHFFQKLKKIPKPKEVPTSDKIQVSWKKWTKALKKKPLFTLKMGRRTSTKLPQRIGWIPNWTKMGSSDVKGEWTMLICHKKRSPQFFFHGKKSLLNWWLKNTTKDYCTLESIIHCLKSGQSIGLYVEESKSKKFWGNAEYVVNTKEVHSRCHQYHHGQKNRLTRSVPFKHTGLDYFGRKIAESREKKGMGLLIHLRCCEGCPSRSCRRPNSRGILVGIAKIYFKMEKS